MAKDHKWEDLYYHKQDEWEKKKSEELQERWKAESEGRICPQCDSVIPREYITIQDEKETKYYDGPAGGGVQTTTEITWHIEEIKCPKCGWSKQLRKWKEKSPWEKFVDWINDLFD